MSLILAAVTAAAVLAASLALLRYMRRPAPGQAPAPDPAQADLHPPFILQHHAHDPTHSDL